MGFRKNENEIYRAFRCFRIWEAMLSIKKRLKISKMKLNFVTWNYQLQFDFSTKEERSCHEEKNLSNIATAKRISIEIKTPAEVTAVTYPHHNLGHRARRLMIKPLKQHHGYLQKIIPYKWNSIFKDEVNHKRKTSEEFLENPQSFLKDLCGDKGIQTLPMANKDPLENLAMSTIESNLLHNLSLYEEIFTELSNTLPIPKTTCDDDETKDEPSETGLDTSCEKQARYTIHP